MKPVILILAAGGSTRMGTGRDKLSEQVEGIPLLRRVAEQALATSLQVFACLPDLTHPRFALLPKGVIAIPVPQAAEGMGASLRTGITALPADITAVMILPADMPELTTEDLQTVLAAHKADHITRATTASGTPGHPVIFPRHLFTALQGLRGDTGARSVLKANRSLVNLVPLPAEHALTDLDTPEAWTAWRARQR